MPMRSSTYLRTLLPCFIYRGRVLAWQCSLCCKMFSLTIEEAEREDSFRPPGHIQHMFRLHNCQLALSVLSEEVQQHSRS